MSFAHRSLNGISRYVARQLLIGTALVSLVLVFIVWLTQSLRFLQFVMNKGLPLGTWLQLTAYMLPGFLTLILPFAFFFVVLFVYNKLSMDKELVVVQAAGMSRVGLALPAIVCATGLTVAALVLSSSIVPAAVRGFKDLQWMIRTDVSQVLLREGTFNALGQGLTVYVRARSIGGELLDIMVDDARISERPVTLLAKRGTVTGSETGSKVMLFDGSRQEKTETGALSVLYFESYVLDLGQLEPPPGTRIPDNRERHTLELLRLREVDGFSARDVSRMRAEGHQRLALPLNVLGYALVAVAWLLLGPHDRRGQTGRMTGAVATIVGLQAMALGAMNATAKAAGLAPLMYMVAFLPIVGSAIVLSRPDVLAWVSMQLGRLRTVSRET